VAGNPLRAHPDLRVPFLGGQIWRSRSDLGAGTAHQAQGPSESTGPAAFNEAGSACADLVPIRPAVLLQRPQLARQLSKARIGYKLLDNVMPA
jgi:hypothetical protein